MSEIKPIDESCGKRAHEEIKSLNQFFNKTTHKGLAWAFYVNGADDFRRAAIKEFETLKYKAASLKDIVYLDGVLAILESLPAPGKEDSNVN